MIYVYNRVFNDKVMLSYNQQFYSEYEGYRRGQ